MFGFWNGTNIGCNGGETVLPSLTWCNRWNTSPWNLKKLCRRCWKDWWKARNSTSCLFDMVVWETKSSNSPFSGAVFTARLSQFPYWPAIFISVTIFKEDGCKFDIRMPAVDQMKLSCSGKVQEHKMNWKHYKSTRFHGCSSLVQINLQKALCTSSPGGFVSGP